MFAAELAGAIGDAEALGWGDASVEGRAGRGELARARETLEAVQQVRRSARRVKQRHNRGVALYMLASLNGPEGLSPGAAMPLIASKRPFFECFSSKRNDQVEAALSDAAGAAAVKVGDLAAAIDAADTLGWSAAGRGGEEPAAAARKAIEEITALLAAAAGAAKAVEPGEMSALVAKAKQRRVETEPDVERLAGILAMPEEKLLQLQARELLWLSRLPFVFRCRCRYIVLIGVHFWSSCVQPAL